MKEMYIILRLTSLKVVVIMFADIEAEVDPWRVQCTKHVRVYVSAQEGV